MCIAKLNLQVKSAGKAIATLNVSKFMGMVNNLYEFHELSKIT